MSATYAVMGLDKSGLAAVRHLIAKGHRVLAWDDNPVQLDRAKALGAEIINLYDGQYDCELVLTPGIGYDHPVARKFSISRAAGEGGEQREPGGGSLHSRQPPPQPSPAARERERIISDIELFARDNPSARVIGITGTNGKSTTTALIHHILKNAGLKAEIGGNFGTSPLDLPKADFYVLELSSYQLERCPSLKVEVGVVLNLTPDHLERHGDMQGYAAAKANLFKNGTGTVVFGTDDPYTLQIGEQAAKRGWQPRPLIVPHDGCFEGFDLTHYDTLPGRHNWQNCLAAIHTCRALGLQDDVIHAGLSDFPGLPHRQQLVARLHGIEFINDSKATNADATDKALGCYENIYWIVGGRPKAGGLNGLEGHMKRIHKAYVVGEAAQDFARWLDANKVAHEQCGIIKTATLRAYEDALKEQRSAVILLSPACASLDQFKNYEERGNLFAELAASLAKDNTQRVAVSS